MKDFIVDSKGRCFLCVNQTNSNASSSSAKSIQFLSRYLKTDMGLMFLENEPAPPELLAKVKKSELKVELCEECSALNKTFSRLYRQLERIEMEMKSCLNSIQSKLLTAPDKDFTGSSIEDSSGLMGKLKIAKVLRREAMKKCSAKLKRAGPRIKLRHLSYNKILKETTRPKGEVHGHDLDLPNNMKSSESSLLGPTLMNKQDMDGAYLVTQEGPSYGDIPNNDDDEGWNMDHLEDHNYHYQLDNSDIVNPPTESNNNPDSNLTLGNDASIKTDTGKHQCSICKKEFATAYTFRNHYKSSHLKLGYSCSACGKVFSYPNDIKRHMASVHMGLKYGCKNCTKRFSDPRALRRHDKSAHQGQRFQCQFCPTTFSALSARKRHIMRMKCGQLKPVDGAV